MKFGVREICKVALKAKAHQKLGKREFFKDETVLWFDSLKTSSLEGAATTTYATGGSGNSRLIAWEGEKTLTFVMEDALLSPESFAVLAGAGLIDATDTPIYVHMTSQVEVSTDNTIKLDGQVCWNIGKQTPTAPLTVGEVASSGVMVSSVNVGEKFIYHPGADIFCVTLDDNGEPITESCVPAKVTVSGTSEKDYTTTIICHADGKNNSSTNVTAGSIVLVDYYVQRKKGAQQIEITPDKFGGNFYLEGSTLFRQTNGKDLAAEFIIPNAKVQTSFNFAMASTGDPSTFTFTMDAFPDYTKFDKTHKVLAAIQIIEDEQDAAEAFRAPCKEAKSGE